MRISQEKQIRIIKIINLKHALNPHIHKLHAMVS